MAAKVGKLNQREVIYKEKMQLREAVRGQMAAWSRQQLDDSDDLLFQSFLALPLIKKAKTVLLYYGIGPEPHTGRLITQLLTAGKKLCLPRCLPKRQMEARLVTSIEGMSPGAFGIPEPTPLHPLLPKEEIDLILVPALCLDRQGYRLGQGGGYYDRYLVDYKGQSLAFCRELLLKERLPRGFFDLPVSMVLTESELLVPAANREKREHCPRFL